jgi:Putative addiction module component
MSQLELEQLIFDLPRETRAELAHRLISSLTEPTEAESDALLAKVALKRLEELKTGKATGISGEEALSRARQALQ